MRNRAREERERKRTVVSKIGRIATKQNVFRFISSWQERLRARAIDYIIGKQQQQHHQQQ